MRNPGEAFKPGCLHSKNIDVFEVVNLGGKVADHTQFHGVHQYNLSTA
jgi:hypothetical protein